MSVSMGRTRLPPATDEVARGVVREPVRLGDGLQQAALDLPRPTRTASSSAASGNRRSSAAVTGETGDARRGIGGRSGDEAVPVGSPALAVPVPVTCSP